MSRLDLERSAVFAADDDSFGAVDFDPLAEFGLNFAGGLSFAAIDGVDQIGLTPPFSFDGMRNITNRADKNFVWPPGNPPSPGIPFTRTVSG